MCYKKYIYKKIYAALNLTGDLNLILKTKFVFSISCFQVSPIRFFDDRHLEGLVTSSIQEEK